MFRMKTQFLFHSMWTFLKIKMHLLVHWLGLWFRNQSRLMFLITRLVILQQRMLLWCIVRLRAYFASGQQQGVLPHSLVCFNLLFFFFIWHLEDFLTFLNLKFLGHTSPILCASFSPTGSLLATGSGDTNARLWDLDTETPSHVLSGHKGWVLCVEWEAMERKLATGGHDGHVRAGPVCDFWFFFLVLRNFCYRCDYGIQRLANPLEKSWKAIQNG